METLRVGDGLTVDLHTPVCDIEYQGCEGPATVAYNVHGCTLHYACENCSTVMMEIILRSFNKFEDMHCKKCKKKYELPSYVQVVKLQGDQ